MRLGWPAEQTALVSMATLSCAQVRAGVRERGGRGTRTTAPCASSLDSLEPLLPRELQTCARSSQPSESTSKLTCSPAPSNSTRRPPPPPNAVPLALAVFNRTRPALAPALHRSRHADRGTLPYSDRLHLGSGAREGRALARRARGGGVALGRTSGAGTRLGGFDGVRRVRDSTLEGSGAGLAGQEGAEDAARRTGGAASHQWHTTRLVTSRRGWPNVRQSTTDPVLRSPTRPILTPPQQPCRSSSPKLTCSSSTSSVCSTPTLTASGRSWFVLALSPPLPVESRADDRVWRRRPVVRLDRDQGCWSPLRQLGVQEGRRRPRQAVGSRSLRANEGCDGLGTGTDDGSSPHPSLSAGELNPDELERIVTIMQNPLQFKIPQWFVNRQK